MMAAFSVTDAAFEGFRLTRERPGVVAAWAVLYAVMSLITVVVMISTIGPEFAALSAAAQNGGATGSAEQVRQYQKLAPFFGAILPFVLVFWSVLTCAVYRAVLRPDLGGFGRLRFGGDEIRMIGLTVIVWLMMFASLFLSVLFVTFGGLLAAGSGILAGVLGNLISLGVFCVTVWVWVRLSLAGPATFVSGEIHVFRSWGLTRGRFWTIFGAYVLAALMAIVVFLLALVIFTAAAGVFLIVSGRSLSDVGRLFEPGAATLAAYFTPAQIIYQAFWAVLQVVVYAVLMSPAAVIHGALTGRPVNA